ncbi:MAG: hypothetical protein C4524_01810 [Candidatus Zixiibacteriota bacterium]|nr:MAG: hypothetical protein C4524_01810 [candidate division Zixibacteria bacterium]
MIPDTTLNLNPMRHLRLAIVLIALIALLPAVRASAQDTQARYARKSISYTEAVLPVGPGASLSAEQEAFLLKALRAEIEMPRFDYNPLPEGVMTAFRREMEARGARDLETTAGIMNDVLAEEILRVVDLEKEARAQGLVSEEQRHSFVVEKAKESGITAEHFETILNSAYVYLPVISQVTVQRNDAGTHVTASLRGGIVWYALRQGEEGPYVELLARREASGYGFASQKPRDKRKGLDRSAAQYAFASAAEVLARNLRVATQEIPEFQLTNPLTNTGAGWVEFPCGTKEGLAVDDKYVIAEFYEQADGSLERKELGMVRVSRVKDNREGRGDSRARTVIGGGYERGMLALEHPRLPIDLSFRLAFLPATLTAGEYADGPSGSTAPDFSVGGDMEGRLAAGQLYFNYNLARATGISQLFTTIYGEAGTALWPEPEIASAPAELEAHAFGEEIPAGLYWGGGGGLTKKFYLNRLHLGLEALLSYGQYRFTGEYPTGDGEHPDYTWMADALGLTLNGNLELALGYDLNLGGGASYRLFPATTGWDYTFDDNTVDLSEVEGLPGLDLGGVGFQVYLTWSLPSLAYDPVKMVRGAMER